MQPINRPYDFVRDHINVHYLNQKKTNIWHQGPRRKLQVLTNRIRSNKTRKEMAQRPQETKTRKETARRPQEMKMNEKI